MDGDVIKMDGGSVTLILTKQTIGETTEFIMKLHFDTLISRNVDHITAKGTINLAWTDRSGKYVCFGSDTFLDGSYVDGGTAYCVLPITPDEDALIDCEIEISAWKVQRKKRPRESDEDLLSVWNKTI